jgi:putative Ca2+/H+ antiporter (TMEM165/GDT1 family)
MPDLIHILYVLGVSAGTMFLVEAGDKTLFLALALQTRFRKPWEVLGGILLALTVQHTISALLGGWVAVHVPEKTLDLALTVSFTAFGVWALLPEKKERIESFGRSAFWTSAVLFFLAEFGDMTELATAALSARTHEPLLVIFGTIVGVMAADGLVIFLGARFAHRLNPRLIHWIAAGLFFGWGGYSFWRFCSLTF